MAKKNPNYQDPELVRHLGKDSKLTYDTHDYLGRKYKKDGCFPKGTLINTASGKRDISKIVEGDVVHSLNLKGGLICNSKVLKKFRYTERQIFKIVLMDGSTVSTTSHHSFMRDGIWVKASKLTTGDEIFFINTLRTVKSADLIESKETVYNLVVENNFNFIANDALVNCYTYFRNTRVTFWKLKMLFTKAKEFKLKLKGAIFTT